MLINYLSNAADYVLRRFILFILLSAALRSNAADYVLRRFIYLFILFIFFYFLFTVRSQKLLDRFTQNFQELCILV